MSALTGVDESWSFLDPAYAAAHGIRVIWDYLSHDPTKDWTAAQILACHQHGVGAGFLWETTSNRALSGYNGGVADGRDAGNELTSLIKQVGYSPRTPVAVIAAYDFDTNPTQYAVLNGYAQGFHDGLAGRAMNGAYGEADLIDELGALIDVAFQTYAWSGGRLSPRAALYQYLNGQTVDGATVDFDRIINDSALGVWWPTGHEPSGGGTQLGAFLMALTDAQQAEMYNNLHLLGNALNLAGAPPNVSWAQWVGDLRGAATEAFGGVTATQALHSAVLYGPPTDLSQEAYQAGPGAALWAAYNVNIGDAAAQTRYLDGYSTWVSTMQAADAANIAVIVAKLDQILARPAASLTDEQVQAIAAAVAALHHDLTEADVVDAITKTIKIGATA